MFIVLWKVFLATTKTVSLWENLKCKAATDLIHSSTICDLHFWHFLSALYCWLMCFWIVLKPCKIIFLTNFRRQKNSRPHENYKWSRSIIQLFTVDTIENILSLPLTSVVTLLSIRSILYIFSHFNLYHWPLDGILSFCHYIMTLWIMLLFCSSC